MPAKVVAELLKTKQIDLKGAFDLAEPSGLWYPLESAIVDYILKTKISNEEVELILQKIPKPDMAFLLASRGWRSETILNLVCQDPEKAVNYALFIEQAASDQTRLAACLKPETAFHYALYVDRGPHDLTRKACCRQAEFAYAYAADIDCGPRDDTRRAACKKPYYAYCYALYVDRGPHPQTRLAASKDPLYALNYAIYVDGQPTQETLQGARRSNTIYEQYIEKLRETHPNHPLLATPA